MQPVGSKFNSHKEEEDTKKPGENVINFHLLNIILKLPFSFP